MKTCSMNSWRGKHGRSLPGIFMLDRRGVTALVHLAEEQKSWLKVGGLEPSTSQWNTPILPVEKHGTGKYCTAHDLRAISAILKTKTVLVPNPFTALTNLSPEQRWFTCIDLANAFFCLPLHHSLRDVFSFSYRGQQLRYTRLPQGFALSPGIFNQVLKQMLELCVMPAGCTLVQIWTTS